MMKKRILRACAPMLLLLSLFGASVAQASPAAADPHGCAYQTRNLGSADDCVAAIQEMISFTSLHHIPVTGRYDNYTKWFVWTYQNEYSISYPDVGMYPDGIVGPRTWDVLCRRTIMLDSPKGDIPWKAIWAIFILGCRDQT